MIDIYTTLSGNNNGHDCEITCTGTIDESKRTIELHYELNSDSIALTKPENLLGKKFTIGAKSTTSQFYIAYGCFFPQNKLFLSSSGMGAISGSFESLIMQDNPDETYDKMMFTFEGIEQMFTLIDFQVDLPDYDGPLTISRPGLEEKRYPVNDSTSGSIVSIFDNIPTEPVPVIHIGQKKYITISFASAQTAQSLLVTLSNIKQYIEFLCSREIQLSDIHFSSENPNCWKTAKVIKDPILIPNTFIVPIESNPYGFSEEDFFSGMQGWLTNADKYSRVIDIWKKTVYNSRVTDEGLFIWRCQAFELLCALTEEIEVVARENLADTQSYPNIRNYLYAVNSKYDIAAIAEPHFSKTKDVRDILTHNNPRKTATDSQRKNAYNIIWHFLITTMGKIMGFKCHSPGLILIEN